MISENETKIKNEMCTESKNKIFIFLEFYFIVKRLNYKMSVHINIACNSDYLALFSMSL